ncbi:MAG: DUF5714 domain-containing protein [Pseudomonadota bacterium]
MIISGLEDWERVSWDGLVLYVRPEAPDWFVPSEKGDAILRKLRAGQPWQDETLTGLDRVKARQFLSILPETVVSQPYKGRGRCLTLTGLTEFWFHVTDRCNLACRHCLFSCNGTGAVMDFHLFRSVVDQVHDLGARTLYFTGGEPLVHPRIRAMCRYVLDKSPDTHLVMLTNGFAIPGFEPFIRSLDLSRIHFQISVDGDGPLHDQVRGRGTHAVLMEAINVLSALGADITLAMTVHQGNLGFMSGLIDLAGQFSITNVHFLWLFVTGNATSDGFAGPREIFPFLEKAHYHARRAGIVIDNIQAMTEQVFSVPGTRHDLSNAGWESLAMAPDGSIYPTPALIGRPDALCGKADSGIGAVWRHSLILSKIRSLSVEGDDKLRNNPLKFITGGCDLDHSFYAGGEFTGYDPYLELYDRIALMLIREHVDRHRDGLGRVWPGVLARMGDRLENCDYTGSGVVFTHSNCVLSFSGARKKVEAFYAGAARNPEADAAILNPVCYPPDQIAHIPDYARVRSFGCGSPVMDAAVQEGETVVDLGSGTGVECFIASRITGKSGRVVGIDMTDIMLDLATRASRDTANTLGYGNTVFVKGFLEDIPLESGCADAVISNCVINLTSDKPGTLNEIFRILKPGGRLVVSDVVTDSRPGPGILNDPELRGECIAGAMVLNQLMALLEQTGFVNLKIIKRFFYREVKNHRFYSVTYQGNRPGAEQALKSVIYPGPFAAVMTDTGEILVRGQVLDLCVSHALETDPSLYILDALGNALGMEGQNTCACYLPPEDQAPVREISGPVRSPLQTAGPGDTTAQGLGIARSMTGCMVCSAPLVYTDGLEKGVCHYCQALLPVDARCVNGHFVCNQCHSRDAVKVAETILTSTRETDMITLMNIVRSHPGVPLHGPEHHFILPGVILAAFRNSGGALDNDRILAGIQRGKAVPGGVCAFWGTCGAVTGAGIALGIILESSPLKPRPRRIVQEITAAIIKELATIEAARCCQRETWTVLKMVGDLSLKVLGVELKAEGSVSCAQKHLNKECALKQCPYF